MFLTTEEHSIIKLLISLIAEWSLVYIGTNININANLMALLEHREEYHAGYACAAYSASAAVDWTEYKAAVFEFTATAAAETICPNSKAKLFDRCLVILDNLRVLPKCKGWCICRLFVNAGGVRYLFHIV